MMEAKRYIFFGNDTFSNFWTIRQKKPRTNKYAIENILKSQVFRKKQTLIETDAGKEFVNKNFTDFLKEK